MAKDSQGSSHHLKVVGGAYGKRKDLIYEYDALRAITIHPAEHIGIADRVGSLEEGKDADIVIVDGSPFELTGVIRHVLIDGKEVK